MYFNKACFYGVYDDSLHLDQHNSLHFTTQNHIGGLCTQPSLLALGSYCTEVPLHSKMQAFGCSYCLEFRLL